MITFLRERNIHWWDVVTYLTLLGALIFLFNTQQQLSDVRHQVTKLQPIVARIVERPRVKTIVIRRTIVRNIHVPAKIHTRTVVGPTGARGAAGRSVRGAQGRAGPKGSRGAPGLRGAAGTAPSVDEIIGELCRRYSLVCITSKIHLP